jgi:hypothetical protein
MKETPKYCKFKINDQLILKNYEHNNSNLVTKLLVAGYLDDKSDRYKLYITEIIEKFKGIPGYPQVGEFIYYSYYRVEKYYQIDINKKLIGIIENI